MMAPETDWKALTYELAEALNFALNHLHARGTGLVMSMETGKTKTWQRYLAGVIAKVPGAEVDWESIDALSLPAKQRRAYFAKKRTQSAAEDAA